jgi:signal transduction histidine kinase
MGTIGRILLVEDDPKDVELTLIALEQYHLANEVVVTQDGEEALDYLYRRGNFTTRANSNPALLLLDLNLPKVDGLEVLQQIKSDDQLRLIPVVMLTSSREERDMVAGYKLGVNAYVIKPVDFGEFVNTIKEITERKLAEEALKKAQTELAHVSRVTALGELAASIAHEVNQPLTAIINNANACLDLLPGDINQLDDVREALSDIINDAKRASAVLARIRGLVKKSPLQKTRLQLRDVVSAVLVLARNEAATRRVNIQTKIPEDLPFVSGDDIQLQQVLLNLIMNGMDAMSGVEESRRLLLISGRRDRHGGLLVATIAVQDFGVGLKTEAIDRLFDAFYTTKPQGLGMGLAISSSIIEDHGGRLWAEPNKGPGATFLMSLPAAD